MTASIGYPEPVAPRTNPSPSTPLLTAIRRRFDEWTRSLPPPEILRLVWGLKVVAASALVAATGIAFAAWVPFSAPIFHLRPWPAIATYAAPLALQMVCRRLANRERAELFAALTLICSFLLQLFCVLLVVNSSLIGAVLFSPWLLVVAGTHGYFYRAGIRFPFVSAATVAASAVGLWLAPSWQHVAVLLVAGVGSAILAILIGEFTCMFDRSRDESERLRAAIQAQLVWEHSLRADRLAGSLEQVAQWNHDIRNALTEVVCRAKLLGMLAGDGGGAGNHAETRSTLEGMKRSLDVVVAGFEELQRMSRFAEPAARQSVSLIPIVEAVVSAARMRFPEVEVAIDAPAPPVKALVYGGTVSAHRILDNLVINACEGDGRRAAHRVDVSVRQVPGAARIEIRDDGPGFPHHLLEGPAPAFGTTKRHGTGLGLHSVEQIVAVNRGRMSRSNPPQEGALVTVELPTEEPDTSSQEPEARSRPGSERGTAS